MPGAMCGWLYVQRDVCVDICPDMRPKGRMPEHILPEYMSGYMTEGTYARICVQRDVRLNICVDEWPNGR